MQLVALRLHDLARLFRHRYGIELPDDDAGREDLEIAINHLAHLPRHRRAIADWIGLWAPWLTAKEQADIVGPALANPQYFGADNLAWRLRLTAGERRMIGITTIGAIDENKAARTKRRRKRGRDRKTAARKDKGNMTRKEYETNSISAKTPWIEEGVSRATWYRRKRETGASRETTPATA